MFVITVVYATARCLRRSSYTARTVTSPSWRQTIFINSSSWAVNVDDFGRMTTSYLVLVLNCQAEIFRPSFSVLQEPDEGSCEALRSSDASHNSRPRYIRRGNSRLPSRASHPC